MFTVNQVVSIIDDRPEACCNGKLGTIRQLEAGDYGIFFIVETDHVCSVRYFEPETAKKSGCESICSISEHIPLELEEPIEETIDSEDSLPETQPLLSNVGNENFQDDLPVTADLVSEGSSVAEIELEAIVDEVPNSSLRPVKCALCSQLFAPVPETYVSYGNSFGPGEMVLYGCQDCMKLLGAPKVMIELQDRWLAGTSSTASNIPIITDDDED
ncbi:MAG: hypothetical protein JNN15_11705 [Blastocatellia bacterium]|nr:hypothetical protein [Blastocatellia bacterium]